uniref:Uncharacterized protein n=1 Tax=Glossina brevipalpis TaxID=37001 RepID=A0A1A9X052_9MUSC
MTKVVNQMMIKPHFITTCLYHNITIAAFFHSGSDTTLSFLLFMIFNFHSSEDDLFVLNFRVYFLAGALVIASSHKTHFKLKWISIVCKEVSFKGSGYVVRCEYFWICLKY